MLLPSSSALNVRAYGKMMKQREISVTIRRAKKDDMTQVYKMIRVSLHLRNNTQSGSC